MYREFRFFARCDDRFAASRVAPEGANTAQLAQRAFGERLNEFDDDPRHTHITVKTFQRYLAPGEYRLLEERTGYVGPGSNPGPYDLRLGRDRNVSFEKSYFMGEIALNCRWSAYHHLFLHKNSHLFTRLWGSDDVEPVFEVRYASPKSPDDRMTFTEARDAAYAEVRGWTFDEGFGPVQAEDVHVEFLVYVKVKPDSEPVLRKRRAFVCVPGKRTAPPVRRLTVNQGDKA